MQFQKVTIPQAVGNMRSRSTKSRMKLSLARKQSEHDDFGSVAKPRAVLRIVRDTFESKRNTGTTHRWRFVKYDCGGNEKHWLMPPMFMINTTDGSDQVAPSKGEGYGLHNHKEWHSLATQNQGTRTTCPCLQYLCVYQHSECLQLQMKHKKPIIE